MKVEVFCVNSFVKSWRGGNPAGVVLSTKNLSEKDMQTIAHKVRFSETAFITRNKNIFKARYFTPNKEVDLCGHATIAAFFLLLKKRIISKGKYELNTKAGILSIEVKKDKIFMSQMLPRFFNIVKKEEIQACLKLGENKFISSLPCQIVSTGLKDIIIPVVDMKTLFSIKPDFKLISELSRRHGVVGLHLFALRTKGKIATQCRNFAPLYGINEESATGTSNCALACYLYKRGIKKKIFIFEQGYSMNRPSEILVRLKVKNRKISNVSVGGSARMYKKMQIII